MINFLKHEKSGTRWKNAKNSSNAFFSLDNVFSVSCGTPLCLALTLFMVLLYFLAFEGGIDKAHAGSVSNAYSINLTFVFNTEV